MGPTTLVSREQVRNGELFLRRLAATPVAPVAAAWVKTDEDGQPYLYIVSPEAEQRNFQGFHRLFKELRTFNEVRPDPFDQLDSFSIKLIGPSARLALGMLENYAHWPDSSPIWHTGSVLGSVSIDGAYIYPATMFAPTQAQPTT